jgi:hypothetical protein
MKYLLLTANLVDQKDTEYRGMSESLPRHISWLGITRRDKALPLCTLSIRCIQLTNLLYIRFIQRRILDVKHFYWTSAEPYHARYSRNVPQVVTYDRNDRVDK